MCIEQKGNTRLRRKVNFQALLKPDCVLRLSHSKLQKKKKNWNDRRNNRASNFNVNNQLLKIHETFDNWIHSTDSKAGRRQGRQTDRPPATHTEHPTHTCFNRNCRVMVKPKTVGIDGWLMNLCRDRMISLAYLQRPHKYFANHSSRITTFKSRKKIKLKKGACAWVWRQASTFNALVVNISCQVFPSLLIAC